jgi:hypothetical protein
MGETDMWKVINIPEKDRDKWEVDPLKKRIKDLGNEELKNIIEDLFVTKQRNERKISSLETLACLTYSYLKDEKDKKRNLRDMIPLFIKNGIWGPRLKHFKADDEPGEKPFEYGDWFEYYVSLSTKIGESKLFGPILSNQKKIRFSVWIDNRIFNGYWLVYRKDEEDWSSCYCYKKDPFIYQESGNYEIDLTVIKESRTTDIFFIAKGEA